MSWNEVKIGLAAIGSKVFESRNRSTTAADGYPVTVLTIRVPETIASKLVRATDIERWFMLRGFQLITTKSKSSRFEFEDIEVLLTYEENSLQQITLNLQVELNVRDRLEIWGKFVKELCEIHRLQLIDAQVGLVDSGAFEGLVKRSFAWECFLKREHSQLDFGGYPETNDSL